MRLCDGCFLRDRGAGGLGGRDWVSHLGQATHYTQRADAEYRQEQVDPTVQRPGSPYRRPPETVLVTVRITYELVSNDELVAA